MIPQLPNCYSPNCSRTGGSHTDLLSAGGMGGIGTDGVGWAVPLPSPHGSVSAVTARSRDSFHEFFDDTLGGANLGHDDLTLDQDLLVLRARGTFRAAIAMSKLRQPVFAIRYFLAFENRLLDLLLVRHHHAAMRDDVAEATTV